MSPGSPQFGFDSQFYRLGGADPAHTQLLWDALSRQPDPRLVEGFGVTPATFGPWTISPSRGGFAWTVKADPTPREKVKWHLRDWHTDRPTPDGVRIVLIGESAAGSWGYHGEYCLSALLRSSLMRELKREVEVIDLSLLGATWDGHSLPAIRASMTLDPDIVVAFAGNNEARHLIPDLEARDVEHVPGGYGARWSFLEGPPAARVQMLRTAYAERMSTSLARTVTLIRAFGKELVFVVPPCNVRDWSPVEVIPHHLHDSTLRTWMDAMRTGERRLATGGAGSESAFAHAVELDGGMCQLSLYRLGRAQLQRGAHAAEETLDRAVAAGLGPFVYAPPSLPLFGRDRQLELLRALKVPYVDMQAALLDEGGPPGREFFLDYCHMSAAGHTVLVKRLCAALARSTRLTSLGASPPMADVSVDEPSPHEAALAALIAAINNFWNGQPRGIVDHWLSRAMRHDEVARIVSFLADHICTSYRERLTLSALRELGIVDAFLNERFLTFGLRFLYHERFDVDLLRLIMRHARGAVDDDAVSPCRHTSGLLRSQEYKLKSLFYLDRGKGFARPTRGWSRRGWEQLGRDFVACDLAGEVDFPLDDPSEASLVRLVASPAWPGMTQHVTVAANGNELGAVELDRPYVVAELKCGRGQFRAGINTLSFRWSSLFSPEGIHDLDERQRYWLAYGPYPVAAVVHDLTLIR